MNPQSNPHLKVKIFEAVTGKFLETKTFAYGSFGTVSDEYSSNSGKRRGMGNALGKGPFPQSYKDQKPTIIYKLSAQVDIFP